MLDTTMLASETTCRVVLSDKAMGKTRGIVEEKDREGVDDSMMDEPVRKKKKRDMGGLDEKLMNEPVGRKKKKEKISE